MLRADRTTSRWCGCARARSPASPPRSRPPRCAARPRGDLLVVGWGTHLRLDRRSGERSCSNKARAVSHVHLRYLNPLPSDLGDILSRFKKVLVPEMNLGQLVKILRAEYLVDAVGLNKIQGLPVQGLGNHQPHQSHVGGVVLMATTSASPKLTRKDFVSDQDVRWCPGCGDYAILAQVQKVMPELGRSAGEHRLHFRHRLLEPLPLLHEHLRFPQHPRPCAGDRHGAESSRGPTSSVWVATGDGDALSIGGNHFIHVMRRNLDINILLFNNRIYGLTKGQYSPTSEQGKITKSTPIGSVDHPFNPISVALGADGTFVARSDRRRSQTSAGYHPACVRASRNRVRRDPAELQHLQRRRLRRSHRERIKADHQLVLEHGKPLVFGKNRDKGIRMNGMRPEVVSRRRQDLRQHRGARREQPRARVHARKFRASDAGSNRRVLFDLAADLRRCNEQADHRRGCQGQRRSAEAAQRRRHLDPGAHSSPF